MLPFFPLRAGYDVGFANPARNSCGLLKHDTETDA